MSTSTSLCAYLWYKHHYSFCVFWVAVQITLTISVVYIRGCMLWSDLAQWPPNQTLVSTLWYHWTDHTGRPLEPQIHWYATGTTLDYASTQWCLSGDPVLICIIGTHWKTTGDTSTLGCHLNPTGWCYLQVLSQWRSSVILHNWTLWNTTGRPLEDHWKHTGNVLATNNSLSSGIQVYTGV